MAENSPGVWRSVWQLILVPTLVTLAITILRLVGELQHWSKAWFNAQAGGGGAIVGITWLAPIFGIYFAVRLSANGEGPRSSWRAIGFAFLAVVIVFGSSYIGAAFHVQHNFHERLLYIWGVSILAAVVTLPGWPALFKTLLAYGYAARIPVAIVMFFAFQSNWGTHYDASPPGITSEMGLWSRYLWLGFFPQLFFWVGFTIVSGMLFGSLAVALIRVSRRLAQSTA